MTADGEIRLTEEGRERVMKVNRRYAVFAEVLERLGVPEDKACEVACKMEHIVPDDVFLLIERKLAEEKGRDRNAEEQRAEDQTVGVV